MNTEITCQNTSDASVDTLKYSRPRYHIHEQNDAFVVGVDLPGVDKASLDVRTEKGQLVVESLRENPLPDGAKLLHDEGAHEGYRLVLKLGAQVNGEDVEASLENGVLRLRLGKPTAAQSRKISIA